MLSPVKLTFSPDSTDITATAMVRTFDDQGVVNHWHKFSIVCRTPQELWNCITAIQHKGTEALNKASDRVTSSRAGANIKINYDEFIAAWRAAGNEIKRVPCGTSAFATSSIDVDAVIAKALEGIENTLSATLHETLDNVEVLADPEAI